MLASDDPKSVGEQTIVGLIDMARQAASRRTLTLFLLMPYHKPVFDRLALVPDDKTIQDFRVNPDGMSELEVLLSDMALGDTCDLFVPDAWSSVTTIVGSMMGGKGRLSPGVAQTHGRGGWRIRGGCCDQAA